jgi:hypothetical protein
VSVSARDDEATYTKWLRGAFLFYGSVGLVMAAVILAARLSHLGIQFAGN